MIDVTGQSEVMYYYHFDGLGSVIALSNENSEIVERYSYDAYGEPNHTSSVGNPHLFTGRRLDPETGNYYYRARYYSPKLGRFLQTDLVGYLAGLNLYTYVGNNPGNMVDPLGLWTFGIGASGMGSFGHSGYAQFQLVIDSRGNIGLQYTLGYAAGTPALSATLTGTLTSAGTINQLGGTGISMGGSIPTMGIDVVGGHGYAGGEFNIGPTVPGFVVGETHTHVTHTTTVELFNYWEDMYKPLHQFGFKWKEAEIAAQQELKEFLEEAYNDICDAIADWLKK